MESTPLRTYGGVPGADRRAERRAQLIEAGLELLGAAGDAAVGEGTLSVRGVCRQAGLAARYFYESFADRDALAVAVYDHVVQELAAVTLEAVEAAPPEAGAKVRAGLGRLVRHVAEDPRRGRLLFSPILGSGVLAERRAESTRLFVRLLGLQAREFYGIGGGARLDVAAEVLVGGLAQVLTSWLAGTLRLGEEEVVAHCAEIFLSIAEAR
ncbi:DNA-binding transcriptional regulator, AcrR family [Amycolatopsis arida]|uniref:DNA-binding transcriptional regulator, AcrR family n=1 Tax=Amycolatopsis arida TaxID=587909 RepID=A0A1I5ZBZ8_9PSEU|nr:TetR/AcrR family transcriptional regulator [Amycolatopsis arida]TDX89506.1 AcrR family transcriptional regulator [Amycolatopsis arida]SFQ53982.1 DNA-binding transcriptional regulator, AcrR family [Amycolatopsis arida]